jgi:hypothetical protein
VKYLLIDENLFGEDIAHFYRKLFYLNCVFCKKPQDILCKLKSFENESKYFCFDSQSFRYLELCIFDVQQQKLVVLPKKDQTIQNLEQIVFENAGGLLKKINFQKVVESDNYFYPCKWDNGGDSKQNNYKKQNSNKKQNSDFV